MAKAIKGDRKPSTKSPTSGASQGPNGVLLSAKIYNELKLVNRQSDSCPEDEQFVNIEHRVQKERERVGVDST